MGNNKISEPCTVYSTRRRQITADEIKSFANSERVEIEGNSDKWYKISITWDDCSLIINNLNNLDSDLKDHLDEMRNYIYKFSDNKSDKWYNLNLISRTYLIKEYFGLISTPDITARILLFIKSFADMGKGLIFRGDSFYSPTMEIVFDPANPHSSKEPVYWPDSFERKERTIKYLNSQNIPTIDIPPVVSEQEVVFRTPREIADRVQALYSTASTAAFENNFTKKEMWMILDNNKSLLTPEEQKFVSGFWMKKKDRIKHLWRYESVWVLLWALKVFDDISFPSDVCKSGDIQKLLKVRLNDTSGFKKLASLELRPAGEILDHLDLMYRCHWATRNSQIKGLPIPQLLDADVIYERHYALNWLVQFKDYEWDDVITDT